MNVAVQAIANDPNDPASDAPFAHVVRLLNNDLQNARFHFSRCQQQVDGSRRQIVSSEKEAAQYARVITQLQMALGQLSAWAGEEAATEEKRVPRREPVTSKNAKTNHSPGATERPEGARRWLAFRDDGAAVELWHLDCGLERTTAGCVYRSRFFFGMYIEDCVVSRALVEAGGSQARVAAARKDLLKFGIHLGDPNADVVAD